jgi:uncharacterized protein (DUF924 family)
MVFPRDFDAPLNLLFIAFQQWHQNQVDSWVPAVDQLAAEHPSLAYYEFPTIYQMNHLARIFLNEGMRAGIPNEATRRRTVTLYIDKRPFRDALAIPDESEIAVILFDQQGQVLWRSSGAYSMEKGIALQTAVLSLQPSL